MPPPSDLPPTMFRILSNPKKFVPLPTLKTISSQTMATKRYLTWALCPQVTTPAPAAAAAPTEKKQEEAEKPAADPKKEPAKSKTNKK